jgi:2-iminobutanoate/2-iminopropanoate deaminase
MTHHRRAVEASGAPGAIGPYSHAIVSNGFVFCAGQLPLDPATGELIEGGAGEQARRCLENLAAVCEAAGASLADAVRVTVYLADLQSDWAEVNEAYASFFEGGDPPARVAVGVKALPKEALVEIDAVVALPE